MNLVKRLLEHALFTFITLMIFFICVLLSMLIWESLQHKSADYPDTDNFEYIYSQDEITKDLQLKAIQSEANTEHLTISGRLHNSSTNNWEYVSIAMSYYVEDIEMGQCGFAHQENIKPGSNHHFAITCQQLMANKLPSKFSYKLSLSDGKRKIKK